VTDIHTKLSPAFGLSWQVRIHLKFTFRDNWRCNGKGEAFLKISQLSAVRSFEVFSTSVSQMFGSRKVWQRPPKTEKTIAITKYLMSEVGENTSGIFV